jgi:hypothetical protein
VWGDNTTHRPNSHPSNSSARQPGIHAHRRPADQDENYSVIEAQNHLSGAALTASRQPEYASN